MIQEENHHKPLSYMLLLSGIILPPALLFAVSADLPHIFLFTVVGMVLALLVRKPVPYSDRSVIYSLVLSIVAAALFDLVFPMRDNRLGYISIFFHPNILVPFLLYLSVCVTFFRPHPRGLGIIVSSCLVCMLFGGDVFNDNVAAERMPFCNPLVKNIYKFFGVITVVELIMMLWAIFYCIGDAARVEVKKLKWQRLFLKASILLLVPVIGGGGMYWYVKNENTVRKLENYLLRVGVKKFSRQPGNIEFNQQVDLNATLTPDIRNNQEMILLRVKSKNPPGYLRGKAYVTYGKGLWTGKEDAGPVFKEEKYGGLIAYTSFFLQPPTPERKRYEYDVFPAGGFSTRFLLLSGAVSQINVIADKLECDRDGSIEVKEWMKDGGYSYFTEKSEQESAWPLPENPVDPGYLQIPGEMIPELDRFLDEVKKNQSGKPLTDSQRIALLIRYFNNNFQYSLEGSNPGGKDPVINFMFTSRKGHCELFASSMVLLLRREGIPARYVTGFICEEQHPSGSYFVSRLGNAHAWLEAWPRDLGKWVLAEPTPPSGVPNFHHKWGMAEHWGDRLGQMFRETMALLRRGVVAKAIISVASSVYSFAFDFVAHPVRGPLALLALLGGLFWLRRYLRGKRQRIKAKALSDQRAELSRIFAKVEKTLSRRFGIPRDPGMTVEEWLTRLQRENRLPEGINELLRQYRDLRFAGEEPAAAAVEQFRQTALRSLRQWKKG